MLYLIENEVEGFALRVSASKDVGSGYTRRVNPRWSEIPESGGDRSFIVAVKTIAGGEKRQRKRAEQLRKRRSRNLQPHVELAYTYLALAMPRIQTEEKGEEQLNIEAAEQELKKLLPEVKGALGWPKANPVEWSYRITEEVLESTSTKEARKMLEREIPHGVIFPQRLKLIEERVKHDLKEVAKPILKALKDTATRDHLALISLGADRGGEPRVVLVDEAKNRLEVPAWKLVDLLEHPRATRRLYTFPADYQRERYPEVVFNEERVGDLVARYDPEDSFLRAMVVATTMSKSSGRGGPSSRPVTFYLDQDYLACLWLVLKRITGDRKRFRDLLKKAEAQTEIDPFGLN